MKRFLTLSLALSLATQLVLAGNDNKRGQAGATELLINPWARSSGWNGANSGGIRGIESMNLNIAGLAYVRQTDLALSAQRYMSGSGINVQAVGFAQRLSPTGVLGISFMNMSLGDFVQTTYQLPEGTGNNFSPSYFNLAMGYAKTFSRSITGGISLRGVYQGIANASAFGIAFDAGVQYQTGDKNQFKFGVALRNVGPKMQYSGEGLSFKGNRDQIGLTLSNRIAEFEMPALLNIGASYDILLPSQFLRITPAFNFTSNSYTKDNLVPGVELAFREMFMLRTSYFVTNDFLKKDVARTDVYTGFAAGATFELPISEFLGGTSAEATLGATGEAGAAAAGDKASSQVKLGIDYSYRPTNPYAGTHALGIVLKF